MSVPAASRAPAEHRADVLPPGEYRLPGPSPDGLWRRRGGVIGHLLTVGGHDVLLRAAQGADGRVSFGARHVAPDPGGGSGPASIAAADLPVDAALGIAMDRWRVALAVDQDLRPFVAAHGRDPIIGASVRGRPWLRPRRRTSVFEAALCAICEQLIAYDDAVAITRRIVARHGRSAPWTLTAGAGADDRPYRLSAVPTAEQVAASLVPAHFERCGLAPARASALHRVARELASGRINAVGEGERLLTRLGRIPEVGPWTLALVATQALNRSDLPPSGDLNLRKALGRMQTGDPRARVPEAEVEAFLARYAPWGALAAAHLMATPPDRLPLPPVGGASRALTTRGTPGASPRGWPSHPASSGPRRPPRPGGSRW